MTREQLICKHIWRKTFGGYCTECFLTRKAEREWKSDTEVLPDTTDFRAEYIRKPENLRLKIRPLPQLPAITEAEMGMPASYKGYISEGHLVPDAKQPANFNSNGQ